MNGLEIAAGARMTDFDVFDFENAWRHLDRTGRILQPPYPVEDPRYLYYLIGALSYEKQRYIFAAINALDQLPRTPTTTRNLIKALAHPVQKARVMVIYQIGANRDTNAIEPLYDTFIHDPDPGIRLAAAYVLAELGDGRVFDALVDYLEKGDKEQRARAARALGYLGDGRAVDILIRATQEYQYRYTEDVLDASADALGNLGDPRGIPALGRMIAMGSVHEFENDPARLALIKIGRKHPEALIDIVFGGEIIHPFDVKYEVFETLAPELPINSLIAGLKHRNKNVRDLAASTLGYSGNPEAVKPLIEALQDDSERVRRTITLALGQFKDPEAVPVLIQLIEDRDPDVAGLAMQSLGQIGDPRAIEPLINVLKHETAYPRADNAAAALGRFGDVRAVEPLIEVLSHSQNNHSRWWSARSLGDLGDQRAVDALITALSDSWGTVRSEAVDSLVKLKAVQAVEALIPFLETSKWSLDNPVPYALAQLGDPRGLDALIAAAENLDSKVWFNAHQALIYIRDPRAVPRLIRQLEMHELPNHPLEIGRPPMLGQLEYIGTPEALEAVARWRKRAYAALREAGYEIDEANFSHFPLS
jgi:HEAT repeat protein